MTRMCKECGNQHYFRQTNVVVEEAVYDAEGEFVKVIDATTKDVIAIACDTCGSEETEDQ